MRIVKNIRDLKLDEEQDFFASLIKDEFGCNTCIEDIKNPEFRKHYAKPLNDFVVYNTANPTVEGIRMLGWKRTKPREI